LAAVLTHRPRLALAAILVLAALLRFHDYALVPFHHETADEYQHAWEGWHLLHERTPAAWSTFPDRYPPSQTRDFRWFGDRYVLVRPYFDHPPLFSIPVGLLCSLLGAKEFLDCTLPVMRVIPILCSLAGLLLLYRLARAHQASERAALLACLVYATVPVILQGHRLVKAENLLALLLMGAVLALTEEGRRSPRRAAIIAGLLSALALWTKATGIAVPATVLLMLAARRRFKDAALVAAITGAGLALYLLYVSAYDLGLFLKVLQAQGTTKWVSLDAFQDLLGGKVVVKWFGRGTYLWLLLAAGLAAFGRARALLLPIAVYATVLCLNADHRVIYGWYRIPLYPFLCVAAGLYLETMIEEADLYRALPFALSAVAGALLYALPDAVGQSRPVAWLFAAAALVPFLPGLFGAGEPARRVARAGAGLLLVIFVLANVATVGRLLEVYAATRGQP
jgi:4-amino-4-deoxy-L-arabinose transferase-like glycosyltransferase